jgi:hypothetical protein
MTQHRRPKTKINSTNEKCKTSTRKGTKEIGGYFTVKLGSHV